MWPFCGTRKALSNEQLESLQTLHAWPGQALLSTVSPQAAQEESVPRGTEESWEQRCLSGSVPGFYMNKALWVIHVYLG